MRNLLPWKRQRNSNRAPLGATLFTRENNKVITTMMFHLKLA